MNNAQWWANKLAQQNPQVQQGRPDPTPTMPPSQQPMAPMPSFQQAPTATTRASSASQTASCPDCGSGNYFSVQNAAPRCYDCGYPIQQSGSRYGSLAGAHVEGATQQAQGNSTSSGYNPQAIVGRVN